MVAQLGNDLAVKKQQVLLAQQQQQQQLALGQQTSASDLQQMAALQLDIQRIEEQLALALVRPTLDARTTAHPLASPCRMPAQTLAMHHCIRQCLPSWIKS